jgi:hypothetical protein
VCLFGSSREALVPQIVSKTSWLVLPINVAFNVHAQAPDHVILDRTLLPQKLFAPHQSRHAVHFYENYNDCTAPGVVPVARIMSEFGWQSDAPFFSIKSVTPAQDWDTWCAAAVLSVCMVFSFTTTDRRTCRTGEGIATLCAVVM